GRTRCCPSHRRARQSSDRVHPRLRLSRGGGAHMPERVPARVERGAAAARAHGLGPRESAPLPGESVVGPHGQPALVRHAVREPDLSRLLQGALRALYGRYVPEPVKNSLRLQLALLRRDVEPARASPPTGRIAVLAPHMDDEVFGCGGTIALAADAGAAVAFVYVTDGSKGYPAARLQGPITREAADSEATLVACRKEEAQRAAAVLGVSDLVFLDQPDGVLAVTAAAVSALADTLARRVPSAVFLPFLTDLHHDHWITTCLF